MNGLVRRSLVVMALIACRSGGVGVSEAEVSASASRLSATHRAGMGAMVYDGGTAFRVWAPGAKRVFVAGDWNGWSPEAAELADEHNGNFSGDVPGALRWHKYKFAIDGPVGDRVWRADPRAYRVENSIG